MPVFVGSNAIFNYFSTTATATSSSTMTWATGTAAATTTNSYWCGTMGVPFNTAQEALAMQTAMLNQQQFQQQRGLQQQQFNQQLLQPMPGAEERLRAERVRFAEIDEAMKRARLLLLSFLTPEQRGQLETVGSFIVIGKSGTRYRIRRGHVGNVDVLRKTDDYVVQRLCFHPDNDNELPVYDTMLAQMLHLRDDDIGARRIANVHRYY